MILLSLAVGGVLGTLARYGLAGWVQGWAGGAFTTFSTLSWETVALLQAGAWGRAGAYALGSLGLGLAAVWAGLSLAPAVLGSHSAT